MLARLLALFLITPAIELALLIQVGDLIGFWPTVGLIFFTGVVGSYLARREGLSAWRRFQQQLHAGGLPGKELLDGVIVLIAGALLITPGVLTDVVGLAGLLPPTRALIRKQVMKRITRAMERGTVRVGFGGFDAGTWSAGDAPAPGGEAWKGEGRTTPRHQSGADPFNRGATERSDR